MESKQLSQNSNALFAVAEAIADVLAHRRDAAEARLRASLAAARFARNRYAAFAAAAVAEDQSALARSFLVQARSLRDRTERALRRRIVELIMLSQRVATLPPSPSGGRLPREEAPAIQ